MTAFFGLYAPGERGTTLDKARERLEALADGRSHPTDVRALREDLQTLLDDYKAKTEALRALVHDCLARDFNEHWDSYTGAARLLKEHDHEG